MRKRIMAAVLAIVMLLGMLPAGGLSVAHAAEKQYKVEIVSFAEGAKEELRSSELLEARLYVRTGNSEPWQVTDNYEGTPLAQLTYEWENSLNTYLYLYNSHNMYGIDSDEDRELSISKDGSRSAVGFTWAAVYGYGLTGNSLRGSISVTVKRGNTRIASDSHDKFVSPNLGADMAAIAFGIFEGDSRLVTDILGEAGIVHITCTACTVSDARVKAGGGEHLKVTAETSGFLWFETTTYTLHGLKAGSNSGAVGDATVTINVGKSGCKFHDGNNANGDVQVYVYKKPVTTTTATTLTLTNLDNRCTYYIDGVQGRAVDTNGNGDFTDPEDYVIFENLTPNTDYTVEVKGETGNTKPVYAYVYDKTEPAFTGTINVRLHTNANAAGTLTDIVDLYPAGNLVFRLQNDLGNIATERTAEGVYVAQLSQGVFYPWYTLDGTNYIRGNQQVVVTDRNVSSNIHFYEVSYDLGYDVVGRKTDYFHISGERVKISSEIPTKAGYLFDGWKDEKGNVYPAGATLTESIAKPYLLTAQWVEAVDVYLDVVINHESDDGGHDPADSKDEITLDLVSAPDVSTPYLETGKSITLTSDSHSKHEYTTKPDGVSEAAVEKTTYTANTPTFTDLPADDLYTVVTSKAGYEVQSVNVSKRQNGDIDITVNLKFRPTNQKLGFEVRVDESVPANLVPQAAIVKVLYWSAEHSAWEVITQQADEGGVLQPGVRVDINSVTRTGTGSYPVWVSDGTNPYGYRIVVTSLVYPDGHIVPMSDALTTAHLQQNKTDIYTVTFGDVAAGELYGSLKGAWLDGNGTQHGKLDAEITAQGYNVNFNAQGGTINGKEVYTESNQYKIPDFDGFVPVKEGGYQFEGWYEDSACTNPAEEGKYLQADVTLYAKWKEPLTVQGNVTVAGTYIIDERQHTIHDVDRAATALVALQKKVEDEFVTVESQLVSIDYTTYDSPDVGVGTYAFTGIEDTGAEFRIEVLSSSYVSLYRNEPSAEVYSPLQTAYNDADYSAEFGGDKIAKVDAYLEFRPKSFDLKYEIDAKAIGEGFRPTAAEMLVLYDDGQKGVNPQHWAVISQMVYGSTYHGQTTALTSGTGSNEYSVWNSKPDGTTYYDYAVLLYKYTKNSGESVTFDGVSAPFTVSYNGAAHYDYIKGQSRMLVAKLEPKLYHVSFNLNFTQAADDNIGNSMEDFEMLDATPENALDDTYGTSHTWSHVTDITAAPQRQGYAFIGWFDDKDKDGVKDAGENYITQIAAEVCQDVVLTAEWEELADVYVNIIIDHIAQDDVSHNNDDARHNVSFTLDQRAGATGDFTEIGAMTITWDGSNAVDPADKYDAEQVTATGIDETRYTAKVATFAGVADDMEYTITTLKTGYSVESVDVQRDSNGDVRITATLEYDPSNFDFQFTVELDDAAKSLSAVVKPVAVNVKVTSWYNTPYDEDFGKPADDPTYAWYTITQMRNTYERVALNASGVGSGSYPVWKTLTGETTPYYYRIEVVSYELADGTIIPVANLAANQPSVSANYTTASGIYTAVVYANAPCADPYAGDANALKGAYHNGTTQVGTVKAVVSIQTRTVTLDPNGGVFSDSSTADKVMPGMIRMPNISDKTPSRAGYTFAGWTWTVGAAVETGALLDGDRTLTAQWTPITYTITYEPNGGDMGSNPQTVNYTVEDAVTHPVPTKDGYAFRGWYDNQLCVGTPETGFAVGQTGDKTYYARWEYALASLTIYKTFRDGTQVDPNQVFTFRVVSQSEGIDMLVHVQGEGHVTIHGLPKGDYTVTEQTEWSWRYTPESKAISVSVSAATQEITFTNRYSNNAWINAMHAISNRFIGS